MPDCACTVYTNTELLINNLVIYSLVPVNKANHKKLKFLNMHIILYV